MDFSKIIKSSESVPIDWTRQYDYTELVKEEKESYDHVVVTKDLTEGGIHASSIWSSWFDFLYNKRWKTSLYNEVVSFANTLNEPVILSLGCGYGGHEIQIARSLHEPYQIIAVDLNKHQFTQAEKTVAVQGLQIDFCEIDLNFFELEEGSVDIVFAHAALHHILNLENLFFQIYRGLKPNGRLIVQDIIGQTQVLFWKENVDFTRDLIRKISSKYNIPVHQIDKILPPYAPPDKQAGMEGIRQEEIETQIARYFDPVLMFKYGSFLRMIGTNPILSTMINIEKEDDRTYIESLFRLDLELIEKKKLKPTEMLAVFQKKENTGILHIHQKEYIQPQDEKSSKVRILAFYLPQYHPIPENDQWWGKGFTEWTNVTKAKPLFKYHYQPNLPSDLGFYDLRVPEVRDAQAALASSHGIDGFCYWHYWFGNGKQLLERPFQEVFKTGKPDFPFCLAWANQSWTGIWHGLQDQVLIEQLYPGESDYINHFYHLLPAFQDARYIKINNKPLFVVFTPDCLPDPMRFTSLWNELAIKEGFDGIYFIGIHQLTWDHKKDGFDEKTIHQPGQYVDVYEADNRNRKVTFLSKFHKDRGPKIIDYRKLVISCDFKKFSDKDFLPTILPGWDNTPRSNYNGWVFQGSTPELFKQHMEGAIDYILKKPTGEKIVFIKSWNEWAEGNYLEPDIRWGKSYLEIVRQVKNSVNSLD